MFILSLGGFFFLLIELKHNMYKPVGASKIPLLLLLLPLLLLLKRILPSLSFTVTACKTCGVTPSLCVSLWENHNLKFNSSSCVSLYV